jgi:hypothetical protein
MFHKINVKLHQTLSADELQTMKLVQWKKGTTYYTLIQTHKHGNFTGKKKEKWWKIYVFPN